MTKKYKYTGAKFEQDFLRSFPDDIFAIKLKTMGRGFINVTNICDLLAFKSPKLYLLELKKTEQPSLPFSNIRENQLNGLSKASKKDNIIAGFVINFNRFEETYFLDIDTAQNYIENADRKSFPIDFVRKHGVLINQQIRRTRFDYDINCIIK